MDTFLAGYFRDGDCTLLADEATAERFLSSYAASIESAFAKRDILARVDATKIACGSIVSNTSLNAAMTNVAAIDEQQASRPDLNHQDVLELVIQKAWKDASGSGELTAEIINTSTRPLSTLSGTSCRTTCGHRDCGYMDDFCGGHIACGNVVCRELQTCTPYGICEDDIALTVKRFDVHEVSLPNGEEDPLSSNVTSMVFGPSDPLDKGRYTFECKVVAGEDPLGGDADAPGHYVFSHGEHANDAVAFSLVLEDAQTMHEMYGWEPCTSPHLVGGLVNGLQTFFVRPAEAPHAEASTSWTVDIAKPEIEFTRSPDAIIEPGSTASFSINSTEPVVFLCDLDAGATSNPESLWIARPCFYEASGCNFVPCDPSVPGLSLGVSFAYAGLAEGRHNVTVRATDRAGNVANTQTWIFSLAGCIADGSCYASTPHMAPVRQCETGHYLDLDDDNLCRTCSAKLGCADGHLHCTNDVNSVCGVCDSGFDTTTGENYYDCEHVEQWPVMK